MTYDAVQKHPRYKVSVPVDVVDADGQTQMMHLDDVSLGGVYLATSSPPPPGSVVRVWLTVDDDAGPVQVRGRVVHVLDQETGAAKARAQGMGVRFDDDVAPATERAVRRFVEGIAAQVRMIAVHHAAEVAASMAVVLTHARRLIEHDAKDNPYAAIDLPDDATFDQAMQRAHELACTFADAFADASPPQRARLEQAGSALAGLEAALWARAQAMKARPECDPST